MPKFCLLLIASIFCFSALAQRPDGVIKGKLVDTTSKQGIADATVSLIDKRDSSLVTFTLTSKAGIFEIRGLALGS